MPLTPGTRLGAYEIVAPLGAGGMGEVYRARDTRLQREVAVKVLPTESLHDETARARLLREARLAATLNHPNICTVHEVGEAGGHVYIAMELVGGRPLNDWIAERSGGLATETVVRYGAQIAAALAHAHEHHVIHRDLKSSNVVITTDGRVKVLDFGLARRAWEGPNGATTTLSVALTETGAIVGTPHYLAPEVLRGEKADERSDLWALGVLLHEMASGALPFKGATSFELGSSIMHDMPAPLPERVPAGLRAVITRCLAKEPGERYARASEVRAALEAVGAGAPGRAEGPASDARPRRMLFKIGLATIAVAALAAVWFFDPGGWRKGHGGPGPGEAIRSLAVLPLENFSRDPEQQYFADGMTEELIASLARLRAVRIISRTSVMRFRGSTLSLPAIARQLGVDAIVEGSVQRSAGRMRITAQLIRAATEEHLWSQTYERDPRDAIALQDEVAGAIAREIQAQLSPQQQQQLAGTHPASPRAYEFYLRGRAVLGGLSRADAQAAVGYLKQAIAADSTFAPAYGALAWAYWRNPGWVSSRREDILAARRAADRALALDPELGYSHAAQASLAYREDWHWAVAEREFKTAIELSPSLPEAHHFYSHFLMAEGRVPESLEQSEVFLSLDPLAREAWVHRGWHHLFAGEYEASTADLRQALKIDPANAQALALMSCALERLRRYPEALAAARRAADLDPAQDTLCIAALCAAERGDRALAERQARSLAVERLAGRDFRYEAARVFAMLGRPDDAFRLLAHAADQRDERLAVLVQDPWLAPLRSDPRFAALLRRMGLRA